MSDEKTRTIAETITLPDTDQHDRAYANWRESVNLSDYSAEFLLKKAFFDGAQYGIGLAAAIRNDIEAEYTRRQMEIAEGGAP